VSLVFPATRLSVIAAVRSTDADLRARGLDTLARAYWKPVYKYVRVRWGALPDDAQDLTQEFFSRALDAATFARYDEQRARFRTYLRVCLDGFVANERKAARRLKRGGDAQILSLDTLDFGAAESEVARPGTSNGLEPDDYFRREWIRSVFALALESLRDDCARRGKLTQYRIFERYYLDAADDGAARLTYAQLAAQFDVPVTQVTNYLAFARREFRRLLLEHLRELSASDDEFRADARDLLGAAPE
jgi:RNA polymerase sigma factor (sigma-70 family)